MKKIEKIKTKCVLCGGEMWLQPSKAKNRLYCSKACYSQARSIENMVYKASVNGIKKTFVNLIYDAIRSMSGASIEWCAYTAVEVLCNYDPKKFV